MRAAPACQVSLRRFGVWRGAVLLVAGAGIAVIAAWLLTRESVPTAWILIPSAIGAAILLANGLALAKMPAANLRWDGRAWHLGAPAGDPVTGDLDVAIDLGPWMLLRFSPTTPAHRSRVVWLPVQRSALASQWHALRCAVYSPPQAPADDAPGGS